MTTRRKFLKGLAALPCLGVCKPTVAEPTPEPIPEATAPEPAITFKNDPDTGMYSGKVICPHCFEMAGQGHMCEGYALWLKENKHA